jgi:hypothetical protein
MITLRLDRSRRATITVFGISGNPLKTLHGSVRYVGTTGVLWCVENRNGRKGIPWV